MHWKSHSDSLGGGGPTLVYNHICLNSSEQRYGMGIKIAGGLYCHRLDGKSAKEQLIILIVCFPQPDKEQRLGC